MSGAKRLARPCHVCGRQLESDSARDDYWTECWADSKSHLLIVYGKSQAEALARWRRVAGGRK